VGERPEEPFLLEVFPGADGDAELVEDDGETSAYRSGILARTPLRLRRSAGALHIEIGPREGAYAVPRRPARVVLRGVPPPSRVLLDGLPLESEDAARGYVWRDGRLHIRLEDDGAHHALTVEGCG
jgi:hypothetical protein